MEQDAVEEDGDKVPVDRNVNGTSGSSIYESYKYNVFR